MISLPRLCIYFVYKKNGVGVGVEQHRQIGLSIIVFRPRRFGKSLFVSMLSHYYDRSGAENFDELFGDLYIGQNPRL